MYFAVVPIYQRQFILYRQPYQGGDMQIDLRVCCLHMPKADRDSSISGHFRAEIYKTQKEPCRDAC